MFTYIKLTKYSCMFTYIKFKNIYCCTFTYKIFQACADDKCTIMNYALSKLNNYLRIVIVLYFLYIKSTLYNFSYIFFTLCNQSCSN